MTIGFRVLKKFEKWIAGGATPHASTHEAGGSDVVALTPHHDTHEAGGSDELAVAIAQVTNLGIALNAKEDLANKGEANGYASLDASVLVPLAQIPATLTGKVADPSTTWSNSFKVKVMLYG